ncbi:MAG: hypothetical protein ACRYGK_17835 [Janthinobacterium lividum]
MKNLLEEAGKSAQGERSKHQDESRQLDKLAWKKMPKKAQR